MVLTLLAAGWVLLALGQESDPSVKAKELLQSLRAKPSAETLDDAERRVLEIGEPALPALRDALKGTNPAAVGLAARLIQKLGVADDARILFEALQGNPAQDAVVPCLRALFALDPQGAPDRAIRLLEHKLSAVRSAAANELLGKLRPDHTQELLRLSQSKREDTKIRALGLLGSFATDESLTRLIAALADSNPEAAAAASGALARCAHPGAPAKIEAIVAEAYLDRAWSYACLALAQRLALSPGPVALEGRSAKISLLLSAIGSKDSFVAGSAAVLLAQLGYLSPEGEETGFLDREVPAALVKATASGNYYRDFNSLLPHALRQLQILSGENGLRSGSEWASWWLASRDHFRAQRWATRLAFSAESEFLVEWIRPGESPERICFASDGPGLPGKSDEEYRLSREQAEQMLKMFRDSSARLLSPGESGEKSGKSQASFLFSRAGKVALLRFPNRESGEKHEEALRKLLQAFREQNLWQLFPDLAAYPGREEFLRGEASWWSEESKPGIRALRLKGTILRAMPGASPKLKLLGLSLLQSHPALASMLGKDELASFLPIAGAEDEPPEVRERALALSLKLGDEKIGKGLVDLLSAESTPVSRALLRKTFSLLGAGVARRGLEDARAIVRATAAEAFAAFRTPGSSEPLLRLLQDPEVSVRRSAIYALGLLASADSLEAVIAACDASKELAEASSIRAECCLAVGRIGGEKAVPFLSRMLGDAEVSVRAAAVQGLSDMQGAEGAGLLAEIAFRESEPELAGLASEGLLSSASEGALSSLRSRLDSGKPEVRARATRFLAELRARDAIKPLMELLDETPRDRDLLDAGSILAAQDLGAQQDPVAALRAWSEKPPEPAPRMEDAAERIESLRSPEWFLRAGALRALRLASGTPYPRLGRHSPAEEWEKAYRFFRKLFQERSEKGGL